MATYTGMGDPLSDALGSREVWRGGMPTSAASSVAASSVTTYYYRTAAGAFDSTTSTTALATICDAGGVLLRRLTS